MNQEPLPADGAVQTDLKTMQVVQHLLWHKALQEYDEEDRIGDYVDMVTHSDEGEHVSIRDPFHRDLAIAFELVIQEHLDPWNLDLSKFAELYLKEARNHGVDLVTAGRIILMAWTVLKLQSDEVAEKATLFDAHEEEWDEWDLFDAGAVGAMEDPDYEATFRIVNAKRAPIDEKIRHKGDRRVTLMELIGAFEEVHTEAEERRVLNQQKAANRARLRRQMRGRVGSMMHTEDLEAEIAETWQRVLDHETQPIPLSALHEPEPVDLVQTFNSILFLAKSGRVSVTQEDFPYGEVWLTPSLPEAAGVVAGEVEA